MTETILLLDFLKTVGVGLCLAGIIYLVINSRHWTGVGQAALIHVMQNELDFVRKEVEGVSHSLSDWRQGFIESEERIWKQLRIISTNGAKEREMELAISEVRARVDVVEDQLEKVAEKLDTLLPETEKPLMLTGRK